jgi:hypothetical protein
MDASLAVLGGVLVGLVVMLVLLLRSHNGSLD